MTSNKARMTNDKSRGSGITAAQAELDQLAVRMAESLRCIEEVLSKHRKPMLAYSGGKDSLVIAHLLSAHYEMHTAVAEVSFLFPFLITDLQRAATQLQLELICRDSLNLIWLAAHPQYVFPRTSKDAGNFYKARQQSTVQRVSAAGNYDVVFFGRRLEENSVKAMVYDKRGITQCHPLRHWTHDQIWLYLSLHQLPVPTIYTSTFGRNAGNGPWNIFMGSNDPQECWRVIYETDPATVEAAAHYLPGALEFLTTAQGS